LLISWPAFTTAGGDAIAAGSMTVNLGTNGSVQAVIFPNTGSTPQGTYYKVVVDLDDGTRSTEYWVVPQVPQTTIAAVRSSLVPQSQAMQFVGRDYVDSAIASAAAGAPVQSVNGQTGAVSLTIPAAQVSSDWNASTGVAQILNKPTILSLPGVASDGANGLAITGTLAVGTTVSVSDGSLPVNILRFGADPTGTTDSTAAWNSAIAAATASSPLLGDLLIPPGTYLLCGAQISKGYVHIHGGGSAGYSSSTATQSVLKSTASCATDILYTTVPGLRNVEIDHLAFNLAGQAPVGLYVDTSISWNFHDNSFQGIPIGSIGFKTGGSLYLDFTRNMFASSQGRGIDFQNAYSSVHTSTYYGCNVCWIHGNIFSDGGERLSGIVDFYDNDIEQSAVIYPATTGYQYWGAVDWSDNYVGNLDAHDNYFEMPLGTALVNTTSASAIGTGVQTVTPVSMSKIIAGMILSIDGGSTHEFVSVTSITGSTFTATFVTAHNTAPVTISSPLVGFSLSGSVCLLCRVVGNVINGPGKTHPGSMGVVLGHRPGVGSYTYSLELNDNNFANLDNGVWLPGMANQPGSSTTVFGNQFQPGQVNNYFAGTGAYLTKGSVTTTGNPAKGGQAFQVTPQGIYLSNLPINGSSVAVTNNDATLDISRGNSFTLTFSAPTTINAFYAAPSPVAGQRFSVVSTNGNATLANSAFHLCAGLDATLAANVPIPFLVDYSGVVREECGTLTPPASSADVVRLFGSGTCSGYLKSDGSCGVSSGGVSFLPFSSVTTIAQNTTGWMNVGSGGISTGGYVNSQTPIPANSTLSQLFCATDTNPASGQTITFTLDSGTYTGVDSSVTCTITGGATPPSDKSCSDTTHTLSLNAGTQFALKLVTSATSGSLRPHCMVQVAQ
jgi:hypothetical protein